MLELPPTFTEVTLLHQNHRFAHYKAQHNDGLVFIKCARQKELVGALRQEVWGIMAFGQLAMVSDLPFKVPRVVAIGNEYLATRWVAGNPLALRPDNAAALLPFFVETFAAIDRATQFANPLPTKWAQNPTIAKRLAKRLQKTDYQQFFDEHLIHHAFEHLNAHLPSLEARLTHADITPGNVLDDGASKTLVDFESTSLLWPRFYDVVNLTCNRMVMEPELTGAMQALVEAFFHTIEVDPAAQRDQLNTIALVRLLSIIVETMTPPDALHNTHHTMTEETAARIQTGIERVLNGALYSDI